MTQTMTTGLSLGTEALLTQTLKARLTNPVSSPEFDLHAGVNDVLSDVGMTAADSGGKLTFYGQVPDCAQPHPFWQHGSHRLGRQGHWSGGALESPNWRRTGHLGRCP